MPRRNRDRRASRADQPARELGTAAFQRLEEAPDGDWYVRTVSGTHSVKEYRCPGCDHEIRPGTAHLVVWPADDTGSVADRRHWHQNCWSARQRRHRTRRR